MWDFEPIRLRLDLVVEAQVRDLEGVEALQEERGLERASVNPVGQVLHGRVNTLIVRLKRG
jgi:hypothetical protein